MRPPLGEFSVAHHAAHEESAAQGGDQALNVGIVLIPSDAVAKQAHRADQQRQEQPSRIELVAFKAQDEAQEVQAERHNPEQRNRSDVLREICRDR